MIEDDAVDELLSYTDNASPFGQGSLDRKTRILKLLQLVHNHVFYLGEWWFRWKEFTADVDAGFTSGVIDQFDFGDFPSIGGKCWNRDTGQEVYYKPEPYIQRLQADPNDSEDQATEFSIYGYEVDGVTKDLKKFVQTRKVVRDTPLSMWAHRRAPVLAFTSPGPNTLPEFPDEWVRTVLIPGVRKELQKSKGDIKAWDDMYQEGMQQMLVRCPQNKAGHWTPRSFFADSLR